MALSMTMEQKMTLHVVGQTPAGHTANLDAAPTWTSSNTVVATVQAAADGMSAIVFPVNPNLTATITANAFSGGNPLHSSVDVNILPALATSLVITADAPVLQ